MIKRLLVSLAEKILNRYGYQYGIIKCDRKVSITFESSDKRYQIEHVSSSGDCIRGLAE